MSLVHSSCPRHKYGLVSSGAGKYCKIFDPMFVRRNWKKITVSFMTQYDFLPQNNRFLGQTSNLKSVILSINFSQISSFLTSYLVKILKLTCKLVPSLSAKFKLRKHVFQISAYFYLCPRKFTKKDQEFNFLHQSGSTFVCQMKIKRPVLGQTRRNNNNFFRT